MTFKDIKQGATVYALLKSEGRTQAFTAMVKSACRPVTSQQVIDFVIEFNGLKRQYCIPDSSSVSATDGNSLVLCADKDCFLREVEARKITANDMQTVSDCEAIIKKYDNTFQEAKQVEARFNSMECSLSQLANMVTDLAKKLSKN